MNISSLRRLAAVPLVVATLLAPAILAPAANAASVGTVTLLDSLNRPLPTVDTTVFPSFTTAVASASCPADFDDATRIVVVDGASSIVASSVQTISDTAVPARATLDTPLADYSSAASFSLRIQCLQLQNGIGVASPDYFESTLTVASGTRYIVSPAPIITKVTAVVALDTAPTGAVDEGDPITLTATVTPVEATGVVTFVEGTKKLGEVVAQGGSAELVLIDLPRGSHTVTASFAPDETLDYEPSAPSNAVTVTVIAPVVVPPTSTPTSTPSATPRPTSSAVPAAAADTGATPVEQFLASTGFAGGTALIVALLILVTGAGLLVYRSRQKRSRQNRAAFQNSEPQPENPPGV